MTESQLHIETSHLHPSIGSPAHTGRPSNSSTPTVSSHQPGLTTFPNPFEDEPEQGILPSLLSKVKASFTSASAGLVVGTIVGRDKHASLDPRTTEGDSSARGGQTEAQQIAEAAKRSAGNLHARRQSGPGAGPGSASIITPISTTSLPDVVAAGRPSPIITPSSPRRQQPPMRNRPPLSNASSGGSIPISLTPSIASAASHSNAGPSLLSARRPGPGERQWRPTGAAPAQVTISPVTSVTTTVSASAGKKDEGTGKTGPHAHFGLQAAVAPSRTINHLHSHSHSSSIGGLRVRRSSISTIPDSPSSVSLSQMIAANAELSQNFSYVPGFPLPQDDVRSVRSLGFAKKTGSVSKIIRRLRGEGLR
jgi:1-phosphatidylinositol-3-phosphate 5-kinase